jgi:hypothetical protein
MPLSLLQMREVRSAYAAASSKEPVRKGPLGLYVLMMTPEDAAFVPIQLPASTPTAKGVARHNSARDQTTCESSVTRRAS